MPGAASATPSRVEEHRARRQAIEAAIERLDQLAAERHLPEEIVRPLRAHHRDRLKHIEHRSDGDDGHKKLIELHDEIELQLIAAERQHINDLLSQRQAQGRGAAPDRARARSARGQHRQSARRGMSVGGVRARFGRAARLQSFTGRRLTAENAGINGRIWISNSRKSSAPWRTPRAHSRARR